MATLDAIFDSWSEDSKIDNTELDNESLKIPLLHNKYLKMFISEKIALQKVELQYKTLHKTKTEYFAGTLDMDTIKGMGWEPNPKIILRSDINMHIESDPEVQQQLIKVGIQREKVNALDSILKMISNRGFSIKNAIDWQKMMNGL
jgi:hypothetical protein